LWVDQGIQLRLNVSGRIHRDDGDFDDTVGAIEPSGLDVDDRDPLETCEDFFEALPGGGANCSIVMCRLGRRGSGR
jgi:hypothetical protein